MKIYKQGSKAPRGFGKKLKKVSPKDVGVFKEEPFLGFEITADKPKPKIDPIELTYTYSVNDLLEKAFCDGYYYAQKEFGRTGLSPEQAKQFFTKVGNPKGINTLQSLSKVPVAPKGGNPITKGNLEHDKRNYKIRNFRFHERKKSPDPLHDKQFWKDTVTSLKTNKNKPFISGIGIFE